MGSVYECLPAELRGESITAGRGGGGSTRERKQSEIDETSDRCYIENKSVSQISTGDRRRCENHYKSIMSVYPDPPLRPFHNVQRFPPTYISAVT